MDAIFKSNIVVGCITFHGGDNSISYPWGNFPHQNNPKTGDNAAFEAVAKILKEVSGNNPTLGVQTYNTGIIQDTVYNV